MRRAALLGLLALGCVSETPPPSGTVELTLGGTEDAAGAGFLLLGGDQPLVPGSQGGFHVWIKLRVHGCEPGTYLVRREVRRVSDRKLILRATDTPHDVDDSARDGVWEMPDALPSFMCPTPIGVSVRDELVRFTVSLVDPETDEVLGQTTGDATPRCPPEGDPQRQFCINICSG